MNIRPRANLTFSKCLEMKLDEHIETIAKVSEVAGKEFSIEQVSYITIVLLLFLVVLVISVHCTVCACVCI